MRPLKTLLVDDNPVELHILEEILGERPDIFNIIAPAKSYDEAIAVLSKQTFDLSILDNDLNGYDFRDILSRVSANRLGLIAVTSIKTDELLEKVITIRHIISFPKPHVPRTINLFILRLLEEVTIREKLQQSKFTIRNSKGSFTIPIEDICFIKTAEGKNGEITHFFCDGNTLINFQKELDTRLYLENWENLRTVEQQLDSTVFFRCAKDHIINLNKITGSIIAGHNRHIFFSKVQPTTSKLFAVATKLGREFLERNCYVK